MENSTMEKNYNISSDNCTCVEELSCSYCCSQKYKETWSAPENPFGTENSNLGSGNNILMIQETPGCMEDKKCDASLKDSEIAHVNSDSCLLARTKGGPICDKHSERPEVDLRDSDSNSCVPARIEDGQICDELNAERKVDHIDSDYYSGVSTRTKEEHICDISPNAKHEVDHVDSDPNLCLSVRTKHGYNCDYLEQSLENCDSKTGICTNYPFTEKVIGRSDAETCTDSITQNSKRVRRSTKRKRDGEDSCPVCGLTVRFSDLENHFVKEVENLSKIQNMRHIRKVRFGDKGISDTFVQVKCNRENRLSAKVAKYTKKPVNQVHCPVCSIRLTGSEDEINEHVLNCAEEGFESDLNITEFDDNFEEYEFGNETRVRAISFVPGGYRALQGHSSKSKTTTDVDEDLNVDVDDTLKYGKPQYTELDVIHNLTDTTEIKQLEQLRKAVVTDPTIEPNILESRKWSNNSGEGNGESEKNSSVENSDESNVRNRSECSVNRNNPVSIQNTDECNVGNQDECTENKDNPVNATQSDIVSLLQKRIKSLEEQNSVKCLICLEPYTKPVVSTTCWHVHCEECWLMTMGVKKLCPQCNLIVFPSDLRRIYL